MEQLVICRKMSGDGNRARRRGECLQTGTSATLKQAIGVKDTQSCTPLVSGYTVGTGQLDTRDNALDRSRFHDFTLICNIILHFRFTVGLLCLFADYASFLFYVTNIFSRL